MRRTMMALITFMTSVVGMYVVEATFGGAMDGLYGVFSNTTSKVAMPANWNATAQQSLTNFGFFHHAIIVVVIAIGVWVVLTMVSENDYSRELG